MTGSYSGGKIIFETLKGEPLPPGSTPRRKNAYSGVIGYHVVRAAAATAALSDTENRMWKDQWHNYPEEQGSSSSAMQSDKSQMIRKQTLLSASGMGTSPVFSFWKTGCFV